MKPNRLFGLAAVGLCLLSGAAAHAQEPLAASYAAVQGIKIDFTPSPRTPHYRFELREKGGETLLCAKEFDSLPGRTDVDVYKRQARRSAPRGRRSSRPQ